MKCNSAFLIVLLLFSCSPGRKEQPVYDLVIESATIINTATGKLLENRHIAITGDSIAAINHADSALTWKARKVIDANGKFVIPALWDMHVHFGGGDTLIRENKNLLDLFIANGVTAVRDCSADISPSVFEWRSEINNGSLSGPTIFSSGPKIEGIRSIWPGDQEIGNEEELAKALDSLEKVEADFVKITDNTLSPVLFRAAVTEAHERGFKVSGHIPFSLKATELSKVGLSTVEHMTYLLKAGSPLEDEIIGKVQSNRIDMASANKQLSDSYDPEYALSVYKKLHNNHTAVVPTLTGNRIIAYLDENDHTNDEQLKYLGKGLIKTYDWRVERANKASRGEIAERRKQYEKLCSLIPVIQASGMHILAGTDSGFLNSYIYPGFALHEELKIYVECGLSPLEALRSSVVHGPEFFGLLDRYGSVDAGKKADLLLLNANPLINISATSDIFILIRKGQVFSRQDLDSLLTGLAKRNSSIK